MRVIAAALTILLWAPQLCLAFTPPLTVLLKDIASGKKGTAFELSFTHRIRTDASEQPTVLIERLIRDNRQVRVHWSDTQAAHTVSAEWNGKQYTIPNHPSIASHSKALLQAILATNPDELIGTLRTEQFIRSDQLIQYKPGFEFDGDPNYWRLRENYIIHPDIVLKRLGNEIAYSVVGYDGGKEKRVLFIDHAVRGIARIEWESESGVTAWNLFSYVPHSELGYVPGKMSFETANTVLIESELNSANLLSTKAIKNIRKMKPQNSRDPIPFETALKILLSFR